jgi:ABC-type transport system substrate-binding protein
MDDLPSIPLFFTKSVTGYQDSVQGFQTYPIGWWPLREVWISE